MLGDGSSGDSSSATVSIKSNAVESRTTITERGGSPDIPEESNEDEEEEEESEPEPVYVPEVSQTEFSDVSDTVYATQSMNVRSSPTTNSTKVGGLSKDQALTRTGIGDNGWSRVIYNGRVAYVYTGLITTNKPEQNEEQPEQPVEETIEETVEEPELPENPEAVENTDEKIYNEIVLKVGTIPQVGNNYNIYIFVCVFIISLISYEIIIKKTK